MKKHKGIWKRNKRKIIVLYIYDQDALSYIKRKALETSNILKILVFGSYARRNYRPDSDIDLVILSSDPKKAKKYWQDVQTDILIQFSLIVSILVVSDLSELPKGLQSSILKDGVTLWENKIITS